MASQTSDLIMKVLDCLSERATVTAQNIANAGTPNYRPLRVTFEAALKAAVGQGPAAVKAVKPQVERDPDPANADLRLDKEVATAQATSLRYAALIEILNRRHQIDALPTSGSRPS
jgi:flagellar basal-body rod protein FlgB